MSEAAFVYVTPLEEIPAGELLGMARHREDLSRECSDRGLTEDARRHEAVAREYRNILENAA